MSSRREFLKTSSVAFAGVYFMSPRAFGANDRIRVAVAGLNGRGTAHTAEFLGMKDVEIVYLVDPDTRTFAKHLRSIKAKGAPEPTCVQDIRKVLEDKTVDVVSIATPNHWHALMTVWACQAGKDVYVEKPMSHNVFEGRQAVEAARKYGRIVQHGTQSRSSTSWAQAAEAIKSGKVGKLLVARALCYKDGGTGGNTRGNIGFKEPMAPPSELDFDLWTGPAPKQPYHENLVHYRWHWFWDFGNGDIGNQGVHEMDKARWGIPGGMLPKSVISVGGRIGHNDQGQAPSSQIAVFDYGDAQLIFEVRGLPSSAYMGEKVGNLFHTTEGTVTAGKFIPKGSDKAVSLKELGIEATRGPGGEHFHNFIAAVRSRKVSDLNADVLEGHYSAALIHMANASYRAGAEQPFNGKCFPDNNDASEAFERMVEYLSKENRIALGEWKYRVGRKLTIDAKKERFVGDPEANKFLTRDYRAPFAVPMKV